MIAFWGADPLVASGIGEEDMLTLVLPYIHSAREGVERLGAILEKYGTMSQMVSPFLMWMTFGGWRLSVDIIGLLAEYRMMPM